MTMEDLMKAFGHSLPGEEAKPPALMAEALRDQAQFYTRPNPFKVGDFVTARKGGFIKGAGDPCVVVGVREDAAPEFRAGNPGTPDFGLKLDLRIMRWRDGRFYAIWSESSQYEPWVEPAAASEPAYSEAATLDARAAAIEAA